MGSLRVLAGVVTVPPMRAPAFLAGYHAAPRCPCLRVPCTVYRVPCTQPFFPLPVRFTDPTLTSVPSPRQVSPHRKARCDAPPPRRDSASLCCRVVPCPRRRCGRRQG